MTSPMLVGYARCNFELMPAEEVADPLWRLGRG